MSTKKDKFSIKDKFYMELALDLAKSREGLTGPNPSVGCVIVKNDELISIGQTSFNGRPHAELNAIKNTFGDNIPKISSTKSLSGHPLGAASVHEAIYCLIMMKNNFIAGSANISEMDEEAKKFPIVTKTETGATLNTVMSNSFGFGGTNAALIFEKV